MKFLLVALNAKYIHSNPAIYSLRAYAGLEYADNTEIAEYTINNEPGTILSDLYKRKPDVVGFSCYIWNFNMIQDINYSEFIKYTEDFSKTYTDRTFEEVISNVSYKKSTISFLREILNYYKVDNDLDKHLSSLSNYKHPSVKEIYKMSL